jgi:hypothetical protein
MADVGKSTSFCASLAAGRSVERRNAYRYLTSQSRRAGGPIRVRAHHCQIIIIVRAVGGSVEDDRPDAGLRQTLGLARVQPVRERRAPKCVLALGSMPLDDGMLSIARQSLSSSRISRPVSFHAPSMSVISRLAR